MAIKVTIAFSNLLLANGICRLLEGDKDIKVIDVLKVGTRCHEKVRLLKPDVVLVDFLTLYNGFEETKTNGKTKFMLFDTTCGEKNLNSAILTKGVSAVVPANASLASLKKIIRAVGTEKRSKTTYKSRMSHSRSSRVNCMNTTAGRGRRVVSG